MQMFRNLLNSRLHLTKDSQSECGAVGSEKPLQTLKTLVSNANLCLAGDLKEKKMTQGIGKNDLRR